MDRESLEYSSGVLDEIEAAVTQLGGQMVRLEPEQSGGIPTGVIGTFHSRTGSRGMLYAVFCPHITVSFQPPLSRFMCSWAILWVRKRLRFPSWPHCAMSAFCWAA